MMTHESEKKIMEERLTSQRNEGGNRMMMT